jgi:hypothetical protein
MVMTDISAYLWVLRGASFRPPCSKAQGDEVTYVTVRVPDPSLTWAVPPWPWLKDASLACGFRALCCLAI